MSTGLEGRQHLEALLRVPRGGSLQPIPSQLTRRSGEDCATSQGTGVVWLEVFGLGYGFTISELSFCPSARLEKSGSPSVRLQRRGVACKVALGEGLNSGQPSL